MTISNIEAVDASEQQHSGLETIESERKGDRRAGSLLVVPAMVGLGLFVVWPMADNFRLSLYDRRLTRAEAPFEGLQNWRSFLADESFRSSLGFTVLYATVTVTVSVALALTLAMALVDRPVLRRLVGPVVLFPLATALVVASVGWRFVFDLRGALNAALGVIGIDRVNWLNSTWNARLVVILVGIWSMTGFALLLYQAALAKIPAAVFEAAKVYDRWHGIRPKLALFVPLVSRTTVVAVVVSTIVTLRAFDHILAITEGGPNRATENLAFVAWQRSFRFYDLGEGAAASAILVALVLGIATTQILLLRRVSASESYA
ncbi:MAG: carbohydrate ABC transporter permease [Ilumatobacter sp.]|uniref:carbohydrate ABC transporter permease n=1 Tax=Ilumatobacter sp. TaxID=1967498 RepID=UPI00391AED83